MFGGLTMSDMPAPSEISVKPDANTSAPQTLFAQAAAFTLESAPPVQAQAPVPLDLPKVLTGASGAFLDLDSLDDDTMDVKRSTDNLAAHAPLQDSSSSSTTLFDDLSGGVGGGGGALFSMFDGLNATGGEFETGGDGLELFAGLSTSDTPIQTTPTPNPAPTPTPTPTPTPAVATAVAKAAERKAAVGGGDKKDKKPPKKKFCSLCETLPPEVWCEHEQKLFCKACDAVAHTPAASRSHPRVPCHADGTRKDAPAATTVAFSAETPTPTLSPPTPAVTTSFASDEKPEPERTPLPNPKVTPTPIFKVIIPPTPGPKAAATAPVSPPLPTSAKDDEGQGLRAAELKAAAEANAKRAADAKAAEDARLKAEEEARLKTERETPPPLPSPKKAAPAFICVYECMSVCEQAPPTLEERLEKLHVTFAGLAISHWKELGNIYSRRKAALADETRLENELATAQALVLSSEHKQNLAVQTQDFELASELDEVLENANKRVEHAAKALAGVQENLAQLDLSDGKQTDFCRTLAKRCLEVLIGQLSRL